MISRRHAMALTLGAAVAPLIGRAHAQDGFVLEERLRPAYVDVPRKYVPGVIHVVPHSHYLYYITEKGRALRYGVGVGREGLEFQGIATVDHKAEWPDWRPTDEMIEREPEQYAQFADGVPGGPDNPLGARALYLYQNGVDTYYRIHGTNKPQTIGRSVSNGCIRMLNSHVVHLYNRVPLGTTVVVY